MQGRPANKLKFLKNGMLLLIGRMESVSLVLAKIMCKELYEVVIILIFTNQIVYRIIDILVIIPFNTNGTYLHSLLFVDSFTHVSI